MPTCSNFRRSGAIQLDCFEEVSQLALLGLEIGVVDGPGAGLQGHSIRHADAVLFEAPDALSEKGRRITIDPAVVDSCLAGIVSDHEQSSYIL